MMKKYVAEFLGTFGLAFAVSMSFSGAIPVPTPVVAAITLMVLVYTLGAVSGAHFNPAITIAAWTLRRIRSSDAIGYVAVQLIGGVAACFVTRALIIPARLPVADTLWVGVGEAMGAFFLAFGVSAVMEERVPSVMSGVLIGGSLLLGISLAAPLSNAVLNPAVAVGIGSLSFTYVISPLIGAIAGMHVSRWFAGK